MVNKEVDMFNSEEFKKEFRKQVEKDTWGMGKPMFYMKDGDIVEHWKDGTINVLHTKEELADIEAKLDKKT
jgi:hypothetical protein